MTLQYSVAVRNAQLDQVEVVTGATAKLSIRTGTQPADCSQADAGSLLIQITLPSDYLAAAASGAKAKAGTWSGSATAGGTAGHWRLYDNAGTTCHAQGSVTATGGGGDMTLDNTNIASGQVVTIGTFSLTAGNA